MRIKLLNRDYAVTHGLGDGSGHIRCEPVSGDAASFVRAVKVSCALESGRAGAAADSGCARETVLPVTVEELIEVWEGGTCQRLLSLCLSTCTLRHTALSRELFSAASYV